MKILNVSFVAIVMSHKTLVIVQHFNVVGYLKMGMRAEKTKELTIYLKPKFIEGHCKKRFMFHDTVLTDSLLQSLVKRKICFYAILFQQIEYIFLHGIFMMTAVIIKSFRNSWMMVITFSIICVNIFNCSRLSSG